MAVVAVVHLPSGGHVRPLLPLVAALGERGSRIVQFASPEWEAECVAAGGEFRAVPDIGIDVTEPPPNPIGVAELIARGTELATPWLSEQLLEIGATSSFATRLPSTGAMRQTRRVCRRSSSVP